MNVFLDTSSLIKLYHKDEDKGYTLRKVNKYVSEIYLSKLTEVEFLSFLMRKYREQGKNKFTKDEVTLYIKGFETDKKNGVYNWYDIDDSILELSKIFLEKYAGDVKLYAPDAIQLATAFSLFHNDECEAFSTSDNLLKELFRKEGLPVF